jgi:hypothetical protein
LPTSKVTGKDDSPGWTPVILNDNDGGIGVSPKFNKGCWAGYLILNGHKDGDRVWWLNNIVGWIRIVAYWWI